MKTGRVVVTFEFWVRGSKLLLLLGPQKFSNPVLLCSSVTDTSLPVHFTNKKHHYFFVCFIRGQAEKDFRKEVETIGRVRHKNLVSLLGYCSEGACRYSANSIQFACLNIIASIIFFLLESLLWPHRQDACLPVHGEQ